jgi:A/G-specific adenine glycosylase
MIRRKLLAAYDAGKRSLPWRGETDPYRVWVSEVMLQQTRVETVVPYYRRWMERFPHLNALAEAEEDEVLRAWQGLGYYARARRLHQGARVVRERFGGVLPGNSEGLRELPGIGDYTAGAVASIAFGEVAPAVDGNVRRVLARLFDLADPKPSELRRLATRLVDPARPGDFNQALMELGALICGPRSPRCDECPVRRECLARARGTVGQRPAPKRKRAPGEMNVAVAVVVLRAKAGEPHVLLRKRPGGGLLAGMWEFPGAEFGSGPSGSEAGGSVRREARKEAVALVRNLGQGTLGGAAGAWLPPSRDLPMVRHIYSHLKVRYWPFLFEWEAPAARWLGAEKGEWFSARELDRLPLPVAQQKIAESLLAG